MPTYASEVFLKMHYNLIGIYLKKFPWHKFSKALVQTKICMLLSCKTSQGLSTVRCIYDLQEAYGLLYFPHLFEHRYVFLGTAYENSVLLATL